MKAFFKRLFNPAKASKPAYYFVHIPKTAGTSFIVLLDRFFPVNKIFPHQLWRETKHIDVEHNAEFDLFRGHFGGGGVDVLTHRKIEYLTILRDPLSLAMSTYQFVQREQNTKVHDLVQEQNLSFAEFMSHPMTSSLVKNRLIRNISFDFAEDPAAQEVFLSAETINHLQAIIQQHQPAIDDQQRLQRAQTFLSDCCWFGLLERFDESMQLLCFVMHWPPVGASQKLNTDHSQRTLSSDDQDVAAQINHEDRLFYQFAEQQFVLKLEHMHETLGRLKTHESQTTDELLDINYQQYQSKLLAGQLPDSIAYGFDQVLLGSQWHRRELMEPEKEWFRWTGPGHMAFIDFWLQPADYEITIRLINATSKTVLDRLKITLNNHPLSWETTDSEWVRVLRLQGKKDHIGENGLVRLGLECHEMISHQQAFGSDDERLVGVAVHWIKFDHAN